MASIPLVALDAQTPQQPDLLQKYAQLQQLRGMQQEQAQRAQMAPLQLQAAQQGVQQGGIQLQQQQQALKDQQAVTSSMQQWDGKDINELYPLILKNGGSGGAVVGLKKTVLEQQQAAATAFKNNEQGAQAAATATKTKNDLVTGALSQFSDPKQVPDEQLAPSLLSTVQSLVQQGALDQAHAEAAQKIAQTGDPNAIRQGVDQFRKTLMAQSQIVDEAQKTAATNKTIADTAKLRAETDARDAWLGKNPGKTAADYEIHLAGAKSGAEAAARQPYEMALARQRQALSQGDPNAAAKLLVDGDATLSELKSRGATPDFIARALFGAKQLSAGKYNAQEAEANFKVAQSPANVAFFGSANSLTDKGGTLDQLAAAAKDIPHNQIPVFNSIADVEKAATGSGPIAKYASILLGVSDDYSKVMGGGQGSDSSRTQALHLVPANASPEARAAAIEGIRGAVGSQANSRIGSNPVLKRMYSGTGAAAAPQAGGGIAVGSVITQNGHQYKVTAVDKNGKPTSADPVQ